MDDMKLNNHEMSLAKQIINYQGKNQFYANRMVKFLYGVPLGHSSGKVLLNY